MSKKREMTTGAGTVMSVNDGASGAEYSVSTEDHEEIARLAYRYWQERGCPIGSPDEDWYRAENDLRQVVAAVVTAATA